MSETKAEKFARLADLRLARAIKAIELVGNLASANYASDRLQRIGLIKKLDAAVARARDSFFP